MREERRLREAGNRRLIQLANDNDKRDHNNEN
jgi:hypothetical protein